MKMSRTKFQPREGWWFSDKSGVLPHGDGRLVVIGEKLKVKGKLIICQNALHGSFDPFDALQYAPGEMLHRVLFSDARIEEKDKLGSRSRTVLATRDATPILWHFARRQALTCAHHWNMPDIVRRYLETGDKELRAASRDAAQDAAWDGARDAARDAAWDGAWAAAWAAARDAAWDGAWAAAWAAARQMFNEMVVELFNSPEGATEQCS
jgi:hypothetical protein